MINEKQLLLAMIIYRLLNSINSDITLGKRIVKKIIRLLKKTLAITRDNDPKRYLELLRGSTDIMVNTHTVIKNQDIVRVNICPAAVLNILNYKYQLDLIRMGLNSDVVTDIVSTFGDRYESIFSIKYVNILMSEINNYMDADISMVVKDSPHVCGGVYMNHCNACKYDNLLKNGFEDIDIVNMVDGYKSEQKLLVDKLIADTKANS